MRPLNDHEGDKKKKTQPTETRKPSSRKKEGLSQQQKKKMTVSTWGQVGGKGGEWFDQ